MSSVSPATPVPPLDPSAGRLARLKHAIKHDPRAPVAFFLAGFIFDALVTERPDTTLQIVHQSVYLVLITLLLSAALLESYGLFTPPARLKKAWNYHEHVTQFLIGTLLNVYMFFYFKSGSLLSSIVFILFIAGLLVANEFVHLKSRQVVLKLALYFLCVTSFWLYVVPMILGFVGLAAFAITILVANGFVWATYAFIERGIRKHPESAVVRKEIQKKVLGTGYGVLGVFVVFYLLQIIPPVPLSLNYIGVFRSVKKEAGDYVLTYTRSKWLFWQHGDQSFYARPGDQIVTFARVFAPNGFRDQLQVRWLLKGRDGWQKVDLIPITVSGGREHGFRGYTVKSNYQPGDYRVQIETSDGREIGRISLTVESDGGSDEREIKELRQ
ncbi:MAG: DUF2914 domain-containing protein [Bdellovibrionales bacterium]|nr:DUF2914 domain-containing protein [Bdellovibrionales bacterium]